MTRRAVGSKGDVMPRGNLMYGDNPSSSTQYSLLADTARVQGTNPDGSTPAIVSVKEELIYYPGRSAVSGGMVLSGTRTGAGTITSSGSAAIVYSVEDIFNPISRGKIDGVATGGDITGQITVGLATSASTADCTAVNFQIRNNPTASTAASTATYAWVAALAYTTAIACTTAEIYKTFDIPHLKTSASINAIPFGSRFGVLSQFASTNIIGRVMESSYIQMFVEPSTQ